MSANATATFRDDVQVSDPALAESPWFAVDEAVLPARHVILASALLICATIAVLLFA